MIVDRSDYIDEQSIDSLHPSSVNDRSEILRTLNLAKNRCATLSRGLNQRVDLETATIKEIDGDSIVLRTSGFRRTGRRQIFLSFSIDSRRFFFSSVALSKFAGDLLRIAIPKAIYGAERRDRGRSRSSVPGKEVELLVDGGDAIRARVEDASPGGLGVRVPSDKWQTSWRTLKLRYPGTYGRETFAAIQNQRESSQSGWTRIGLLESVASIQEPISPEVWTEIPPVHGLSSPLKEAEHSERVSFPDEFGREVVGLVDVYGDSGPKTLVILQPGWGETKEAMLSLARTIVETFAASHESVAVLRIDGINQKGESYKNPDSRLRGREYNRFVFSDAVSDIQAAIDFAKPRFSPNRTILVTQSIAALAARRFIASDEKVQINGWISISGSPDLQSMSRSISGGIDYALGYEKGVEFGYQELLGVTIHADRLMHDAAKIGVLHIQDARRDFSRIRIPVSWFHGQYDAWVNFDRVRDVLSYGPRELRRLVTMPSSHRLGWSSFATTAFGTIASEVARLSTGHSLPAIAPDRKDLSSRRSRERKRRPKLETNLREFWKDYLLGRDGTAGIELMTVCDPYGRLMADQIEMLRLKSGERILDLGCGTGPFQSELAQMTGRPPNLRITGLDHVQAAVRRAASRRLTSQGMNLSWLSADLDVVEGQLSIPLRDSSFDAVLASLVLSYVERPEVLLSYIFSLLRPGGRIVISSLVKDADLSRLFQESLAELRISDAARSIPTISQSMIDNAARSFLNDAARILELEAEGSFVFWEPDQLVDLLQEAGFVEIEQRVTFGSPGQAVAVSGSRPNTA